MLVLQVYIKLINPYSYVPNGLTLGDLKGNRFSIVLR